MDLPAGSEAQAVTSQVHEEEPSLLDELRQLHPRAGRPSRKALEKYARESGLPGSRQTFSNLLNGMGKPGQPTVEAFVVACAKFADKRRPPIKLPPEAVDLDRWRDLYAATYPETAAARTATATAAGETGEEDAAFAAARRAYEARLRERYGRVDLEALTPLSEQDEHPAVVLREVFVEQSVRADPPPVELPKELWRRLVEAGEVRDGELPAGLHPDALDMLRQSYQQRPAQPVLQVLAEPGRHRLVLLGDPGAGKSTLARYLALTLAAAPPVSSEESAPGPLATLDGWLPLLVELRTYPTHAGVTVPSWT